MIRILITSRDPLPRGDDAISGADDLQAQVADWLASKNVAFVLPPGCAAILFDDRTGAVVATLAPPPG